MRSRRQAAGEAHRMLTPARRADARNISGGFMRTVAAWPLAAVAALAWIGAAVAGDLKDEVKVQIQSAEMHSGMAPGTYVCAAGHFHVKGTVQNLAAVPVGQVKVEGKALDADCKGGCTASASAK